MSAIRTIFVFWSSQRLDSNVTNAKDLASDRLNLFIITKCQPLQKRTRNLYFKGLKPVKKHFNTLVRILECLFICIRRMNTIQIFIHNVTNNLCKYLCYHQHNKNYDAKNQFVICLIFKNVLKFSELSRLTI